jgi:hypothetical protein
MPTATEFLAKIGEQDRLVELREMVDAFKRAGLRTSRSTIQGYQARGLGPAHFVYGNRAVYPLKSAFEWALGRMRPGQSATA